MSVAQLSRCSTHLKRDNVTSWQHLQHPTEVLHWDRPHSVTMATVFSALLFLLLLARFAVSEPGQLLEYSIPEGGRNVTYIASIIYDVGLGDIYDLALLQTFEFTVLRARPLTPDYFMFQKPWRVAPGKSNRQRCHLCRADWMLYTDWHWCATNRILPADQSQESL